MKIISFKSESTSEEPPLNVTDAQQITVPTVSNTSVMTRNFKIGILYIRLP